MAKRKRKRRSTSKAPSSGRRSPRKRKSPRRRRSLSDGGIVSRLKGSQTVQTTPLRTLLSGASGGTAAIAYHKLFPAGWGKFSKVLGIAAVGLGVAAFGMPQVSAGFVGGATALTFQNGLLGEDDGSFADDDVLSDMPLFLDEDGNAMVLDEDAGEFRYLTEDEMAILDEAEDAEYVEV